MSTSPEATTAEEMARPDVIPPEKWAKPAEVKKILDPYQKDLDQKSPIELEMMIQKGVQEGVFKKAEGDQARPDELFQGMEVQPAAPEAAALLAQMREQMENSLVQEKSAQAIDDVTSVPTLEGRADRFGQMVEEAFRRGELDITRPVPEQKGKPPRLDRNKNPIPNSGEPPVPGKDAQLVSNSRRQGILLQVFEEVKHTAGFGQNELEKIRERINSIGERKDEIRRDEETSRTRAQAYESNESAKRVEEARRKIEAADKAKQSADEEAQKLAAGRVAKNAMIMEKGLHQQTVKVGDVIANPHKDLVKSGRVEKGTGRVLKDYEVTEDAVHDEALKMNELVDQQRQIGKEAFDRIQGYKENSPQAYQAFETAHRQWEAAVNSGHPNPGAEPKLDDFGPTGKRITDRETAHAVAIAEAQRNDPNVFAQSEVHREYQALIDAEPNVEARKMLVEARDAALAEEKTRQVKLTKEHAGNVIFSMKSVTMMRQHAAAGEERKLTIRNAEQAHEIRTMLNADPTPVMEAKVGGFRKGPKMLESWFRVPGNDRLWLVERYNRRTGEMVSQNLISSAEAPHVDKNGKPLPPRTAIDHLSEVRPVDRRELANRPGTRPDGSEGMLKGAKDKVRLGFGVGGNIDGPQGVYAQYQENWNNNPVNINAHAVAAANPNAAPPAPHEPRIQAPEQAVEQHRKQGQPKRGGGYLRWLTRVGSRGPK